MFFLIFQPVGAAILHFFIEDILRYFHARHTTNLGSVYRTTPKNTVCHILPRFDSGVTLSSKIPQSIICGGGKYIII